MIVLVIVSLGAIMVTPRIAERMIAGDEQLLFFSELLAEHLKLAQEEGAPVSITGFKGSANLLKYDGTRVDIPGLRSIQAAEINDERTTGVEYRITIYPDGLCDHFILESDDLIFESSPLLMSVSKREA
ncbi:MAG: hypothetical protein LBV04_07210, partial [Deferribacteraceae bacterium]|jgi:hypothetical protein|nr:hypothetical protein [Deferribacteraceae bacterium]